MRDVVAGLVAAILVFVALSLLTTLHVYRKRHRALREHVLSEAAPSLLSCRPILS